MTAHLDLDDIPEQPMSPNTERAYRSRLRTVDAHAGRPVDDRQLAEALLALGSSRSPSWSTQAVAAAARREPDVVGPQTRRVLRHLRRRRSQPPRQAVAIDWVDADRIIAGCRGLGTPVGDRDAALIAIMSDALLRRSEAAALDAEHVAPSRIGGTVTVDRSKSDQLAVGSVLWISDRTLQLVRRLHIDGGALFRSRAGRRLHGNDVSQVVTRRALEFAGIAGATGHSLRVGSAIELVRRGASLVECQQAGRWASPAMPALYTRSESAALGAMSRLRHTPSPVPHSRTDRVSLVA